jgi:hypothetical protein
MPYRHTGLEANKAQIAVAVDAGESITDLGKRFGVGYPAMKNFIDKHGLERKGVSHPAVSGMRETLLYKLRQCKDDKKENYIVRCPGHQHKVYIDIADYIALWEKANQVGSVEDGQSVNHSQTLHRSHPG